MLGIFSFRHVIALLPLFAAAQQPTQKPGRDELFRTIAQLDRALFDSYNQCELDKFSAFFIDDVEFYHDQGGLTTGNRNLTESVRKNICGKVQRELVPGTLEVCPIAGYGAVETGIHRFRKVNEREATGEAKFIHLWQQKDGVWKITRVISYDHHALAK